MLNPSPQKVLELIDIGIRQAVEYQTASGLPFWEGPEYLMTMSIFHSILIHAKRNCLTLELQPSVIEEYMKLKGRRRNKPPSARTSGRGDICLWYVDTNRPRAIIELKRNANNCHKDLDRVISLVSPKKGLEFGVLCSCIREKVKNGNVDDNADRANKLINERLEIISDKIKDTVDSNENIGFKLIDSPIAPLECDGDEPGEKRNWIWRPVCFKIYRK